MKQNLYYKSIFTFLITLLCHVGFGQDVIKITRANFPQGVLTYGTDDEWIVSVNNTNIEGYFDIYSSATQTTMQTRTNTPIGSYPYNTVAIPGNITKIKLTGGGTGTARSWTPYVSSTSILTKNNYTSGTSLGAKTATSNSASITWDISPNLGYKYFYLNMTGGAAYLNEIEITYQPTSNNQTQVTTPTITPSGNGTGEENIYYNSAEIELATSTPEASIYYTTDGSTPTTSSLQYNEPFSITETKTIKAIAVKDGMDDSEVESKEIKIEISNVLEILDDVVGFESSEGFVANNVYNNTDRILTGNTGKKWSTYYGTPSTSSALIGSQSMQMRWYTSATGNLGNTYTDFDLNGITKVVFTAKSTNNLKMMVERSIDNGTTWTNPQTFDLSNDILDYTYNLSDSGVDNVRFKFSIVLPSSNPSETSNLYLDNVRFYKYIGPEIVLPNSPVANPSTNIEDDSFVANWNLVSDIEQYEVEVYTKIPQENIILEENFDWASGTGGNDGSWSGNIATVNIGNNLNLWIVENGSGANKSIKLGTASKKGILKTPVLSNLIGNATLTFKAGAWDGSSEQTTLILKIEGGGNLSQTSVDMVNGAFTPYTINITNATSTTRITFEGKNTSNSRFFIDDIKISQEILTKHLISDTSFIINQENSKEITGVNLENNTYYYVVRSVKDGLKSTDSEEIKVYNRTTWDGTLWDNDVPNEEIHAVIKGDLQLGTETNVETIEAKTLKIFPDQTLTVKSGSSIQLRDKFENISDQPIVFEEGAYLLQGNDLAENLGNANFKRNATFFRYDSKFWSSPVAGQTFSGFMSNPSAVYTYNEGERNWIAADHQNFVGGIGYIFQAGSNYPFMGQGNETPFTGSFTGVPNNGVFTFQAFKSLSGLGDNGVGNPYGSPISMERFINGNSKVNTLYFWNEDAHYIPGSNPANYRGQKWFSFNKVGSNEGPEHIAPGVGFIARVEESSVLTINNSMRSDVVFGNTQNRNFNQKDRFWLSLNSDNNKENQILIGYVEGATNGIDDKYDARNISNNNSFILSHSNANAMIIEGRQYPLDVNDQIPLYFRASELGDYTIKLENKEGIFNSQPIYLIDNELNLSINLNEETEYSFHSEIGNFTDRFEIRYQPKETLSTNDLDDTTDLIVYKNDKLNKITSKENVIGYKVYDFSGKLITTEKVNQLKDFSLTNQNKGTYIVKFTLENGRVISKKVIF